MGIRVVVARQTLDLRLARFESWIPSQLKKGSLPLGQTLFWYMHILGQWSNVGGWSNTTSTQKSCQAPTFGKAPGLDVLSWLPSRAYGM